MPSRDPDRRVEELLHSPTPPGADDLAAVLAAQHPRLDKRWQVLGALVVAAVGLLWWRGCQSTPTPVPRHTAEVLMPGEGGIAGGDAMPATAGPSAKSTPESAASADVGTADAQHTQASRSALSHRSGRTAATSRHTANNKASSRLNLNSATAADFDRLPGIGPVLAQRIIDWRENNGRFSDVHELLEVKGIGPAKYAKVSPLVRVAG